MTGSSDSSVVRIASWTFPASTVPVLGEQVGALGDRPERGRFHARARAHCPSTIWRRSGGGGPGQGGVGGLGLPEPGSVAGGLGVGQPLGHGAVQVRVRLVAGQQAGPLLGRVDAEGIDIGAWASNGSVIGIIWAVLSVGWCRIRECLPDQLFDVGAGSGDFGVG